MQKIFFLLLFIQIGIQGFFPHLDKPIRKTSKIISPKDPFEGQMISLSAGSFIMGSDKSEITRYPYEVQHQVSVDAFNMSKYEVTQAQWQLIMGSNPAKFNDCANCPVEQVSWDDIQIFLKKLNELTAKKYRLPTEAEWEYACRAGTKTTFYTGSNITTNEANYEGRMTYNDRQKDDYRGKTIPVGSLSPNPWGLYDMQGNVREWCNDWFAKEYETYPNTNPQGASTGLYRVVRGGSWSSLGAFCRSASRDFVEPTARKPHIGFRVAY